MKRQYLNKKQTKNPKKITLIILVVFIGLGLIFYSGVFLNIIGRPIWLSSNFISEKIKDLTYLFKDKKALNRENQILKEENLNLKLSHINYQILENDNLKLKEILNRLPKGEFVLADILSKNNQSFYNTFIIDAGENNGIKEGDLVLAGGEIPIAKIEKVYKKTSLVSLFSNPQQETEAFIDGLNISINLIGRGGGNFEASVPMDLPIENGINVFLPNKNLSVLATIEEIISEPAEPHKKIILSSPVNIQELKRVTVEID